jgi:formylmethanofuran dehydrogenase subunit E-like metal-binding protein
MVKFGFSTVAETMTLGREAARRISEAFQRPIRLEFEKANTQEKVILSSQVFLRFTIRISSSAKSATQASFGRDRKSRQLFLVVVFSENKKKKKTRFDKMDT